YTMKGSKNNHVTREYTVEVGTEDLIQDAKIHLKGDINGDGKITIVDANRANLHFKNKSILSGYEFLCADVNGDGKVTIVDVNRMNLHFKNKNKLW
ncbi:MAG: dockerin type I repeat-containing protein, partial [Clostridia bacterium]|nr:dockerin type I repeat-containing protein [Clostridia bacterium]